IILFFFFFFFFSSRRRHTRFSRDWSSDVCSSDLDFFLDICSELSKLGHNVMIVSLKQHNRKFNSPSNVIVNILKKQKKHKNYYRSEERRVGKECRSKS